MRHTTDDDDDDDHDDHHDKSVLAYTIPHFCRAAGMGRSKIYDEIKRGRLKATHIGGRTVITPRNGRRWLKSYEDAE
jgi:predicted DNA-binding transcriptional regulator AlpA